ncbi:MAG: DUF1887 family protein [Anaerolineae bacterium]|nr:DUF1887 family protein [Anaerolineae bacterium]
MVNKRVRVLVLGGRLTPSLVAVLSDPPDAIEFIVSRDTPERYEQARSVLAEPLEKQLPASPLPAVSPFDWEECQERCGRAVTRHAGAEIMFDVTTAPKFMSFAVEAFAREHGYEAVVVDTAGAREFSLITRQSRPVAFPRKVEEYLKLFGRQHRPSPVFDITKLSVGEQQACQIARQLALGGEAATAALNKFNRWNPWPHGGLITPKEVPTTTEEEFAVFQMLAAHKLITDLQREADGKTGYRTSPNPADTQFVVGRWLEVYVWDVARSLRDKTTGEPLFSDCRMGFEIPDEKSGQKREVDVGCIYQGQFIHCSCKAKAPKESFNKDNLDEMTGVSALLGGDFTTRVFVTNAFQPYDADQWMFARHAEKQKVVLVTGEDLPQLDKILYDQAVEPKYARI